jgi:hypothetical protein
VFKLDEEEYAIVSKKEFLALKKEIERLKKHPLEGSESGETLQSSIDNLNKGLNTMLEVFKQAADDMKLEEHESETLTKQVGPINDKLDTLIDQNQKIAKGLVTIADMVKEKLEEIEKAAERPKLPPLSGGPGPSTRQQSPFSMPPPQAPPQMPSFGSPSGMPQLGEDSGFELPPLTPPGVPPKRNIMSGLMK